MGGEADTLQARRRAFGAERPAGGVEELLEDITAGPKAIFQVGIVSEARPMPVIHAGVVRDRDFQSHKNSMTVCG